MTVALATRLPRSVAVAVVLLLTNAAMAAAGESVPALGAAAAAAAAADSTIAAPPSSPPVIPPPASPPPQSARHHRRRAHRLRHAQADSATVLEWSMGYDGNFDAPDLARDEGLVLSLVWTPSARFELEGDFYAWALQEGSGESADKGHGDTYLTAQYTIVSAPPRRPAVAVAYVVKLPTAAPDDLGSGAADHSLLFPVSMSYSRMELDVSAGIDADGDAGDAGGDDGTDDGGFDWGVSGAAALTFQCTRAFSAQIEWSGQTVDTDDPAGHYASLTAIWQASPTCTLDLGGQVGLDSDAPAYGIMGGFSVAVLGR